MFKRTDPVWMTSQFADLPLEMIRFAKRLNLTYDKRRKALVDSTGEPVAWIAPDVRIGREKLVMWHACGAIDVKVQTLNSIRTMRELHEFQVQCESDPFPEQITNLTVTNLMDDTKRRIATKEYHLEDIASDPQDVPDEFVAPYVDPFDGISNG